MRAAVGASRLGKAREEWLKDSRLKMHHLTSFAGIVLTLIPILYLYMCQFCARNDEMAEYIECVKLLHQVVGILATGADKPVQHVTTLRANMKQLHAVFVRLFDKVKPKLHHMHHVCDAIEYLMKCLCCFVTERKCRLVKQAALYVLRAIEHPVVHEVVNTQCEQLLSGHDVFDKRF